LTEPATTRFTHAVPRSDAPAPHLAPLPSAPIPKHVKSAERALDVLLFLASRVRPVPAAAIAREHGMPKSSLYHLLNVLAAKGFVVHNREEQTWALGVAAFEIGSAYLGSEPLGHLGRPVVRALAEQTRKVSQLFIMQGTEVLTLLREMPRGVELSMVTDVGVRLPAYLTAAGRAMLMHASAKQLNALYPPTRPLVNRNRPGPRNLAELRHELQVSRERGYAVIENTISFGLSATAVPVFSHDDRSIAALTLTQPTAPGAVHDRRGVVEPLLDAAETLSRQLGWRGGDRPSAVG